MTRKKLTPQQTRELAAKAFMSSMTIYKLMRGIPVLETTRLRVAEAMRAMGMVPEEYLPPLDECPVVEMVAAAKGGGDA